MAALPKSPHGRRSSSGGGLRPVVPFGLDDGSAVDEDEEEEIGPAPREQSAFADGAGVDEVEYAYGFVFLPSFWEHTDLTTFTACSGFPYYSMSAVYSMGSVAY
jgi:hypothetical protein